MCGIIGILDRKNGVDEESLRALRDSMSFRGPDGVGEYKENTIAMAMCRLAVIDTARGWQPMRSLNGEVITIQNGEIYNYKSLKHELEQAGFLFHSDSDTEVLAHGYALWGIEGLLERIDGMYAIAIFDRRSQELHLARDRFGEKPLFFSHTMDRFAFASSMLPLAALPWVDTSIDLIALDRYLALHFVPGERTMLKGVRRLLPGERMCINIKTVVVHRSFYYRLHLGDMINYDEKGLQECIEEGIASRLVADVPVGVFLSGGVDSSLVAAMASRDSPGISTFSMGFPENELDERKFADLVARSIGSRHHSFIFEKNDFEGLLAEVVDVLDEPVGDQALLPVYWLSREARRYVTVILSGEGADEIFGGYDYYRMFLPNTAGGISARSLCRIIDNSVAISPSGFPLLTTVDERARLLSQYLFTYDLWERNFIQLLDEASCDLQRAGAADLMSWLPDDLLAKLDRMTMAHGLEGRAPYLSRKIVEAALRIPTRDRVNSITGKVALRRIAEHWLPGEILRRPKQGFVLPMHRWLNQWFKKRGGVGEYCSIGKFPELNMRNTAAVIESRTDERLTFALIVLLEWRKSFMRRAAELREKTIYLKN